MNLLDEILASLANDRARVLMTVLATATSVALLVAVVGFSETTGEQVSVRFDAARAITITASAIDDGGLPADSPARVEALNGVRAGVAMTRTDFRSAQALPSSYRGAPSAIVPVIALTAGGLQSIGAAMLEGREFDTGHNERADRVVLVGSDLRQRLSVGDLRTEQAIYVDGVRFSVMGVFDDPIGDLEKRLIFPHETYAASFGRLAIETLIVAVFPGAAGTVATDVPYVLRPNDPAFISVISPVEPVRLETAVAGDLAELVGILGLMTLAGGAFGISNVTTSSVHRRRSEIGLRRAMGASQPAIFIHISAESAVIGLAGGVVGSLVGILAVIGVSASRGWEPVLSTSLPALGAVGGLIVGVLSGIYPAFVAASVAPISALRTG